MAACWPGMTFSSAPRVAAATAASTEAPGAGVILARNAGYLPVIAFTASKTETCVIAMKRTAGGVPGALDAISAAFALASVTTSAPAGDAAATSESARATKQRRVQVLPIVCSFFVFG